MISLGTGHPVLSRTPIGPYAPVHFSWLKRFALSPAHAKAAAEDKIEPTRDMRVGTIVHHMTLGPHRTKPLVLYPGGDRVGNAWKDFDARTKALNPSAEIVTQKEWEAAQEIVEAIQCDPLMRRYIQGSRREVSLKWKDGGIDCETDGIDIVGDGYIADLKRTSCTEPGGFARHAFKQLWHVQMAFYESAANAHGFDTSKGLFLLGVEPEPPYACTVMKLTPGLVELGRKTYIRWLEQLRVCRENDHWPAYSQAVVDFDVPPWMADDDDA